ncbi:exodeoxyribonuclease VII large subunit [Methylobacillus flagellatus]|uniref:Exodeoxyribonuclease 7 large subunit n=1 Tax=Methylobacillus flagellatus (strain ATCC 51484 / DSM 6875 / VKM B-1610 / KT) TaxID=265072 RepID=Q1H057_METFK|nr:exodeoxyribonuclease VII large subunit [Methylobacillus flagellatus]ABE50130.1 Exodeoxyribonuclease VII large subunit [Methylobacillus flagellatus KT]
MVDPQRILSVSELNRMARELLETSFPLFWISGEISNLTRAASGHWYFSLKDQGAQVRCVMFRSRNAYLDWSPREGDKVEARAVVTLYEARGDFQLTIEFLQRAGLGNLFEAYEKLKNQLAAEGLFAAEHKIAIPAHPRQIGIVTSPDAAALRDVLTTLRRRMPAVNVIIYPTPVQGKGAAKLIADAIRTADQRAECDVLIVCRGGGSIEDLWQFNEEIVARAIHVCTLPVISAVGHETDFTIADFVADVRAPTPTAAAELTTPDRSSLLNTLLQHRNRLARSMQNLLQQRSQHLDYLSRRLLSPMQQAEHKRQHLSQLRLRLTQAMARQLQRQHQHLQAVQQSLAHLNPRAVLQRGYALVEKLNGELVQDSNQLAPGDQVKLTLSKGSAQAEIRDKGT